MGWTAFRVLAPAQAAFEARTTPVSALAICANCTGGLSVPAIHLADALRIRAHEQPRRSGSLPPAWEPGTRLVEIGLRNLGWAWAWAVLRTSSTCSRRALKARLPTRFTMRLQASARPGLPQSMGAGRFPEAGPRWDQVLLGSAWYAESWRRVHWLGPSCPCHPTALALR